MNAAETMNKQFDLILLKTIKFKELPLIGELIQQLDLINSKLQEIFTDLKNVSIKLEK